MTSVEEYQEQLSGHISLKDLVFAKFRTLSVTTTASIFSALLQRRSVLNCFVICDFLSSDVSFFVLYIFQEVKKYKLGDPRTFHYLNQSNCYELVGINDAQDYLATRRAMGIVGMSMEEQVYNFLQLVS